MKTNTKLTKGQLLRLQLDTLDKMNTTSKINSVVTADAAVQNRKFIVGSIDEFGNLSFTANPVTHVGSTTARNECKRLAKLYPGKTFVFAQLYGGERVRVEPTSISL